LEEGKKRDRRVARTQSLVLGAFYDLMLSRGYDGFTVRDLIDRADIGRSTFYEHFESKEDVFEHSVAHPLTALADALLAGAPTDGLRGMVEHFWANRAVARATFDGPPRLVMERVLARLMTARLERCIREARSAARAELPLALVAAQLAGAQLGLVSAWIEADGPCDAATLARALHASGAAMMSALITTAKG
jgi:AcrR family transcriptional regulator